MSLTATQARILRDMADGAVLIQWYGAGSKKHFTSLGNKNIDPRSAHALVRKGYLEADRQGSLFTGRTTYTLTPAGAEAAREGTE